MCCPLYRWVSLRAIKRLVDTNRLKLKKPSVLKVPFPIISLVLLVLALVRMNRRGYCSQENDHDQTLLQETDDEPAIQVYLLLFMLLCGVFVCVLLFCLGAK